MEWYIKVLQNYAYFKGRARRREYWMFNLINFIIVFLMIILDRITNLTFGDFFYNYMYEFFHGPYNGIGIRGVIDTSDPLTIFIFNYGILTWFYSIFVFIPSLAVSVRRLHDIGKSGWMILINLIPIFGSIWLLVLYLTDSEYTTNAYGTSPKQKEL
jgi:uncharacterized membrane protein YhaH (DUF805 family)